MGPDDPYRGFTSWREAAEWFEKQMERFHESDQTKISERSALLTLIHDLEVMQFRLNASAGKSVSKICDDVIQSVLDMDKGEG